MKYCPSCGADLLGAEISFCSECGKALPDSTHPRSDKQNTAKASENESEKKKGRKLAKNKKAPKHPKKSARMLHIDIILHGGMPKRRHDIVPPAK